MADIVDEAGHSVPPGQGGSLVIRRPFPSLLRTVYNDDNRFVSAYFPEEFGRKFYLAGDSASRDEEGYIRIMGRIDDVLNVSGHRLGTMEIESALVSHPLVAEAAVVGKPHEIKGEAVVAFVMLKGERPVGEEAQKVAAELKAWVAKEIGKIAQPDDIRFGENLPKTRSGKIMRRLLRSLAKGEEVTQDVSTLENPQVMEQLSQSV
jgi:acetyl-CoA synthetase